MARGGCRHRPPPDAGEDDVLLSEAANDKEEILVVECDPAKSEDTRRNWPFLRDRRIDAYAPILNRYIG